MKEIREKLDRILDNAFGSNPMVSEDTKIYLKDAILQLILVEGRNLPKMKLLGEDRSNIC